MSFIFLVDGNVKAASCRSGGLSERGLGAPPAPKSALPLICRAIRRLRVVVLIQGDTKAVPIRNVHSVYIFTITCGLMYERDKSKKPVKDRKDNGESIIYSSSKMEGVTHTQGDGAFEELIRWGHYPPYRVNRENERSNYLSSYLNKFHFTKIIQLIFMFIHQ